jgi:hypothetical protein
VTGQLQAPAALPPGKEPPVHIRQEAGWAPESDWTVWKEENSCIAGNQTRAVQPVAIPTPIKKECGHKKYEASRFGGTPLIETQSQPTVMCRLFTNDV